MVRMVGEVSQTPWKKINMIHVTGPLLSDQCANVPSKWTCRDGFGHRQLERRSSQVRPEAPFVLIQLLAEAYRDAVVNEVKICEYFTLHNGYEPLCTRYGATPLVCIKIWKINLARSTAVPKPFCAAAALGLWNLQCQLRPMSKYIKFPRIKNK